MTIPEDWDRAERSALLTAALRRPGRVVRGETFGFAVRAFCIAMWIVVAVAAGAAFNQISSAHADSPLCAHRGEAHAAQQHTTREADSRWHVMHGQLPTCDLDKDQKHNDSHQDHDSDLPGHRDHAGIHCFHLHCG
jgi:hypothetical protein